MLFDFTGLSDRLAPALTLAVADYVEWHVHRLRRARVAGELDGHGAVGGQEPADHRGGLEAAHLARRRRVAERVRPPRAPLRAVADVHHPVLPRLRLRAGPRAAVQPRRRALPAQRARDLEHARDPLALTDTDIDEITSLPSQKGALLDALHDLQARPRRGPDRARRPRVLDRELQPRARPATPRTPPCARPAVTRGRRSRGSATRPGTSATARPQGAER